MYVGLDTCPLRKVKRCKKKRKKKEISTRDRCLPFRSSVNKARKYSSNESKSKK